ncbi:sulfatase-like hydrolase/transferase [Flammeovirga yaeyamensis]|uniref:Sulfatase-like hydrolase/transferase n=1 Tax=Flammeovirga yaeyamensis TaxID=367791 RepID=A0AAX1ND55_9BACT|nr:sulfatase [Flammeovirga yaeyamensis]MBB3696616.1 arylsulfatase A-like enzyme [Flammeovirga yaeyamensis]NMF33290.1 sulfatase [Flammeovirga yaeyamensis]QWG05431.1 sulfatase-like hydrolase/transferase [Flammeovirga yaeyamensis]
MKFYISLLFFLFFQIRSNVFAQDKPNVLFIAIDDLNDFVGCMNASIKAYTPNIDRLADQAVLFTNAHCQAPICGPSRASIMTGLQPFTSGNYLQLKDRDIQKGNEKVANSILMPDYFKKYGYKTMAAGKIYHGGDQLNSFDEYGGRFSWFGPKPKERMNYDPKKIPHKIGNTLTDWGAFPTHDSLMTDYQVAEWIIDKLNEEHQKPFFLAAGFLSPHVPWHAPQEWMDKFPIDKIELPPYLKEDNDDISEMAKKVNDAPMMPTTEEMIRQGQWKNIIQSYLACVAFMDAQVGKLLDALEKSSYADNTIIVLWSDHGYHLGEKNRFAKQSLWERSTRTILLFKPLNSKKGRCDQPVQLLDIYPTLLDLCQLPAYSLAEGHSLIPLIENNKMEWKFPALSSYGVGNIAIRNNDFRLVQYEDGSSELYDMKKDPDEWTNLSNNKKYAKVKKQLQQWIPKEWAPLSKYSKYNFNEYFKEKSNSNKTIK